MIIVKPSQAGSENEKREWQSWDFKLKILLQNAKSVFTDLKECVNLNKHNKLTLFVSVGLSDNETTAPGRSFRNLKYFHIVVNEMNSLLQFIQCVDEMKKRQRDKERKEKSNQIN